MEIFGCCSSYVECSDNLKCLHLHNSEYNGCQYRQNLEAGRVFYGKNAGMHLKDEAVFDKAPKTKLSDTRIFLSCYSRCFAISAKSRDWYSYSLKSEQFEKLKQCFESTGIPHKVGEPHWSECIIDEPTYDDPAPANSRISFSIDGETFVLSNFNNYLLKFRTAERIAAAFANRNISARVELMGKYSNVRSISIPKTIETKREEKLFELEAPSFSQLSLFDLGLDMAAV